MDWVREEFVLADDAARVDLTRTPALVSTKVDGL
jgi:hypothetical protein